MDDTDSDGIVLRHFSDFSIDGYSVGSRTVTLTFEAAGSNPAFFLVLHFAFVMGGPVTRVCWLARGSDWPGHFLRDSSACSQWE